MELTDVQHKEDKCVLIHFSGHFTVARQPQEDLLTYLSINLCELIIACAINKRYTA